jgi:hypothetical protein
MEVVYFCQRAGFDPRENDLPGSETVISRGLCYLPPLAKVIV